MSDFEDKLQSILGNQDAMSQIMSIAKALGSSDGDSGRQSAQTPPPPPPKQEQPEPAASASPFGGESPFSLLGDLDPKMLQLGMKLFSEYTDGGEDKRLGLLNALRPFVKAERYDTIDRAMQIAKLSRVIRVALKVLKGGGEDV